MLCANRISPAKGSVPMKAVLCGAFLLLWISAGAACAQSAQPDAAPVNPDATPAARALLHEIDAVSGKWTMSGQHNFPNTVSRYSDRVYDLTGHFPEIFGQDFGFSSGEDKDSTLGRPSMIAEAIREYRAGAVIALTWHAVRPTDDEPVTFHDSVQGHLTDWEWEQVLTPGTDLYNRWARQTDVIAGYLQELQNAGVPVLFRAYHEMNGNWFWWGGRPGPHGSAALYRQIYDRFVHLHHLNNLIWVWNVNSPNTNAGPIEDYFPGAGYADVLSMDIYGPFAQRYYDSIVALAAPLHKPIALAEVGTMPTLATLQTQPDWAYFMMWAGMAEGANTPEQLQTMFHAPNILDRGDPRLPQPLPPPAATPLPVNPDATPEAQKLLAALYAVDGRAVLAGEEESVEAPAAQGVSAGAPGERPAIISFTLQNAPATRALAERIEQAAGSGAIVMLRWMPGRPTDGAQSGSLTGFEWEELLKPGSALNTRWAAQADAVATQLRKLERAHIAVLWSPYPEANSVEHWWGGRPGREGSQALTRMLYTRLAAAGVNNLVWNWEPATPGFRTGGNLSLDDSYPGPLYADTLTIDAPTLAGSRFRLDRMVAAFAGGKPFGVLLGAGVPTPAVVDAQTAWSWILLPANADAAAKAAFYGDSRVRAASSTPPPR